MDNRVQNPDRGGHWFCHRQQHHPFKKLCPGFRFCYHVPGEHLPTSLHRSTQIFQLYCSLKAVKMSTQRLLLRPLPFYRIHCFHHHPRSCLTAVESCGRHPFNLAPYVLVPYTSPDVARNMCSLINTRVYYFYKTMYDMLLVNLGACISVLPEHACAGTEKPQISMVRRGLGRLCGSRCCSSSYPPPSWPVSAELRESCLTSTSSTVPPLHNSPFLRGKEGCRVHAELPDKSPLSPSKVKSISLGCS